MPVAETPAQIEALDAEGTGMRVMFEWCGDRFRHSIFAVRMGKPKLMVESLEGDSTEAWPSSPPVQQLHLQPNPSGREMLLLTGMAGKSYWSGSITTSSDLRWTRVGLHFACRHRMPPDWLGVTYRIADGVHAEASRQGSGTLLHVGESLTYELYPSAIVTSLATENTLTSSIELSEDIIRVAATVTPPTTTATTKQWAYEWQLTRPSWIAKRLPN